MVFVVLCLFCCFVGFWVCVCLLARCLFCLEVLRWINSVAMISFIV